MSAPIALHPARMTAAERLDEAAKILAVGAVRLMARKSTSLSVDCGDSSVDFTALQRGHDEDHNRRRDSR
jgi:hypothetical protein